MVDRGLSMSLPMGLIHQLEDKGVRSGKKEEKGGDGLGREEERERSR